MKRNFVILIFLFLAIRNSQGLLCYTCSMIETTVDRKCETDPAHVESGSPTANCNKKYCFTLRIEYKAIKDKISTMARGCDDNPPVASGVSEDTTYRYYSTVCQSDLCNGGTGKDPSGSNGLNNNNDGYGNLRVPGTGDSNKFIPNMFLLILTIIIKIV